MADTADKVKTITFHQIKSPSFSSLFSDGAIGSITPSGYAYLAFYVERSAIPKELIHKVDDDGNVGAIVNGSGKKGVVRELQTGIILDRESLENLGAQIAEMLGELK